jgi:tRNA-modifying protein YgfZ
MTGQATDVTSDYLALRGEAGAVDLQRDVVRASGPDAASFLQGQLSQDVDTIAPRTSALSLLLEPQGKLGLLLRVTRLADDDFLLDTDGGWGEPMRSRLERFRLRTKVDLEPLGEWRCVAVRGPKAHDAVRSADDAGQGTVQVDADWPSLPGVDLLGPAPRAPGVRSCGPEAWEAVRIEAGIPVMGRELVEGAIPAEAGQTVIDRAVSFTKGCFTGQELVARIESRGGKVPRQLRGLVVGTNVLPPLGASVVAGGTEAGTVTSVGESLERRAPVALAVLGRGVEPGSDVTVRWEGGEVPARVEQLPLVS